ncbi:MAG: hypothetical protein PHN38_07890 [Sulfurospirillaceae bacterium]|nr:hypothetical protein [Sulfurospirillaceae bacterium]MDD3462631.1 hypothetical protein [Sulfurospirillaceae bacterium]
MSSRNLSIELRKYAKGLCQIIFVGMSSLVLVSCSSPAKVEDKDVVIKETAPATKTTNYTQALQELGLMTEIYATGELRIQSNPIGDNTGTSGSTGGEIPRDITEMIKSSLNSIGGGVVYIPYDPAFMQNQMVTGYSSFENKMIPEVVITGGITEFDRGLETKGDGTDAGFSMDVKGIPSQLSSSVGFDYSNLEKSGLARITLDFNMINFATMAGVPRMNTVNTIEVQKAMKEKELGITIFGANFGGKGSLKKVQGRHHAVRTLVEISMMQMIGKYLGIPYWRLLGPDALPDQTVLQNFAKNFYKWSNNTKILALQEWLFVHGNDVSVNGVMDARTIAATKKFDPNFNGTLTAELAQKIYMSLPLNNDGYQRRMMLAMGNNNVQPQEPVQQVVQPAKEQVVQQQQPVQKEAVKAKPKQEQSAPAQATQTSAQSAPTASKKTVVKSKATIGRMLSDSDW